MVDYYDILLDGIAFSTRWLYDMSDIIYPSVYMTEQMQPNDRVRMVRGRLREAIRLSQEVRTFNRPKVLAYYRYVFTDTNKFISQVSNVYCGQQDLAD